MVERMRELLRLARQAQSLFYGQRIYDCKSLRVTILQKPQRQFIASTILLVIGGVRIRTQFLFLTQDPRFLVSLKVVTDEAL